VLSVKIRLTRIGFKKKPFYRIVVADSRSPRDGRIIDNIGTYDPKSDPSKIELDKVAEIAHLHPSAFCRFFKEKTGKSLSKYVTDLRISYACKLIIEGKLSVSQVCFESGFNNLSNFNRTFKRQTKMTPTEYFHRFHE